MADGFGIPALISPFGAKMAAALTPAAARLLLQISTGGSGGVPPGGAAGDFLVKVTGTDQDVAWSNVIDGGTY